MTEEQKLRQEYRTKVGSTYNAKWEWYAEWLEKQLLIAREELSKLHQPTVISAVCNSPCCKGIAKHEVKVPNEFYCDECFKQTDL